MTQLPASDARHDDPMARTDEELQALSEAAPDAAARAAAFGFDLAQLRRTGRRVTVSAFVGCGLLAFLITAGWGALIGLSNGSLDPLLTIGAALAMLLPTVLGVITGQISIRLIGGGDLRRAEPWAGALASVVTMAAVIALPTLLSWSTGAIVGAMLGALTFATLEAWPASSIAGAFGTPHPTLPQAVRQMYALPGWLTLRGGDVVPLVTATISSAIAASALVAAAFLSVPVAIGGALVALPLRVLVQRLGLRGHRRAYLVGQGSDAIIFVLTAAIASGVAAASS